MTNKTAVVERTVDRVTVLRIQVADAKQARDQRKQEHQAIQDELAHLQSLQIVSDANGDPVYEAPSADMPKYGRVGNDRDIKMAILEMEKAGKAYRAAYAAHVALRAELEEAEKVARAQEWPIERLDAELQQLIIQDDALFGRLMNCIMALREAVVEWNDHLKAKYAIRSELNGRRAGSRDIGMSGMADSFWDRWFLAGTSDTLIRRQFGLLARGQGRLNPLPDLLVSTRTELETMRSAQAPHN